jgi:hypothetical protein
VTILLLFYIKIVITAIIPLPVLEYLTPLVNSLKSLPHDLQDMYILDRVF